MLTQETVTVPKCWRKSLFVFYFHTKVFLSLHNATIEPLMIDGVSRRCFSYFSGPWQCNLLGIQWDSHKPPDSHPKYLTLCSEDERSIYEFGSTRGKWKMTKLSFWGGVSLYGENSVSYFITRECQTPTNILKITATRSEVGTMNVSFKQ